MPNKPDLKILVFGDIVGRAGREAIKKWLPDYRAKNQPSLVIGNVENLAHGSGITRDTLREMTEIGINFFTSGNHIWKKAEGVDLLTSEPNLIRPANYPNSNPGNGHGVVTIGAYQILIINLIGQVFVNDYADSPFLIFDQILKNYADQKLAAILVDFHAEATSEKMAFGWYVDGRVSAVYGTHTHIPTADARLLLKNTAYITDVGMTGLRDSVLGRGKEEIIRGFLTKTPVKHTVPDEGPAIINACEIIVNPLTGQASNIKLITEQINS